MVRSEFLRARCLIVSGGMSPALHLLWVLLVHLPDIHAAVVLTQTRMSGPVSAGQTVHLECRIQNGNVGSYMYWYRQRPGERPEYVLEHYPNNDIYRGPGITDRFQPSRDTSSNSHILTISSLELRDFAVYYCAAWENGVVFGPGTILDIKSSESLQPSVLLLPPLSGGDRLGFGHSLLSGEWFQAGLSSAALERGWIRDGERGDDRRRVPEHRPDLQAEQLPAGSRRCLEQGLELFLQREPQLAELAAAQHHLFVRLCIVRACRLAAHADCLLLFNAVKQ
ncbi:uncharacterized protein [Hemitrygon akajei]|uniref:uncharacterized protein n=1 Tax=Hemitrygon akajei TaxID=2704970 RepID=UPI003BFA0ED8